MFTLNYRTSELGIWRIDAESSCYDNMFRRKNQLKNYFHIIQFKIVDEKYYVVVWSWKREEIHNWMKEGF